MNSFGRPWTLTSGRIRSETYMDRVFQSGRPAIRLDGRPSELHPGGPKKNNCMYLSTLRSCLGRNVHHLKFTSTKTVIAMTCGRLDLTATFLSLSPIEVCALSTTRIRARLCSDESPADGSSRSLTLASRLPPTTGTHVKSSSSQISTENGSPNLTNLSNGVPRWETLSPISFCPRTRPNLAR